MSTATQRRLAREQRRRGGLQRRVGPVPIWILSLVSLGALAIIGIATANSLSNPATSSTAYAVAEPGVGEVAPDFALPNANGGTYSLSSQRGKTVLLYFHEGLMCAPCWQQLNDIQADVQGFTAQGSTTWLPSRSIPWPLRRNTRTRMA